MTYFQESGVKLAVFTDEFNLVAKAMQEKQRLNTLDDYNHELSGVDVGRQQRFFNKENTVTQEEKRRKASDRIQQLTALQALLNSDPEYAKLYNNVVQLLSEAEIKADNVLEICREKLEQAERMHQENLDNATRLSNGKAVFKDDNGAAYDENDQQIDPDIAEGIVWKEGSPSRGKFKADKDFMNESQAAYNKAYHERYSVLGEIREKVENEGEPVKNKDLEGYQDYLKSYLDSDPEHFVKKKCDLSISKEVQSNVTETITKPVL